MVTKVGVAFQKFPCALRAFHFRTPLSNAGYAPAMSSSRFAHHPHFHLKSDLKSSSKLAYSLPLSLLLSFSLLFSLTWSRDDYCQCTSTMTHFTQLCRIYHSYQLRKTGQDRPRLMMAFLEFAYQSQSSFSTHPFMHLAYHFPFTVNKTLKLTCSSIY